MIAGVILAAGGSSRLGRPKQLLPLAGRPLLSYIVAAALQSDLDDIVLVLGAAAAEIEQALLDTLGPTQTRMFVNDRYHEGQSTSVAAGISALPPSAEAALILLGDQPTITSAVINQLLAGFRSHAAAIVAPVYGGNIRNPMLFRADLFPDLLALTGDQGARSLVQQRAIDIHRVDTGWPTPPPDVDTEEAYRLLQQSWGNAHPIPIRGDGDLDEGSRNPLS